MGVVVAVVDDMVGRATPKERGRNKLVYVHLLRSTPLTQPDRMVAPASRLRCENTSAMRGPDSTVAADEVTWIPLDKPPSLERKRNLVGHAVGRVAWQMTFHRA